MGLHTAVRTRKYRVDLCVHLVRVVPTGGPGGRIRTCKILCTNFWVYPHQLEFNKRPVNCIACIGEEAKESP